MSGTTTNRHYPYPGPSSGNNVPGDLQALATAIDTDVAAIAAGPGAWSTATWTFQDSSAVNMGNAAVHYLIESKKVTLEGIYTSAHAATSGDLNFNGASGVLVPLRSPSVNAWRVAGATRVAVPDMYFSAGVLYIKNGATYAAGTVFHFSVVYEGS